MTNETEQLRDRIAKILSLTYTSGPAKVTFEDIAAAQAIIDHLGLTIETHATAPTPPPATSQDGEAMSDSGYINRAFRPEPGRKYFNHMAKHTRGQWHRHWLLSSGQYIKTSDPDAGRKYEWAVVGESGPELVRLRTLREPPHSSS